MRTSTAVTLAIAAVAPVVAAATPLAARDTSPLSARDILDLDAREFAELYARSKVSGQTASEHLADIAGHLANIGLNTWAATKMRRDDIEARAKVKGQSASEHLADIAGHLANIGMNTWAATQMRRDEIEARAKVKNQSASEHLADIAGNLANIGLSTWAATRMRRDFPDLLELRDFAELDARAKVKGQTASEHLADIAGHLANIGLNTWAATQMRRDDLEARARVKGQSASEHLADIAGNLANIGLSTWAATKMRREFPELDLSARDMVEFAVRHELETRSKIKDQTAGEHLADIAGHLANIGLNTWAATKMRRDEPGFLSRRNKMSAEAAATFGPYSTSPMAPIRTNPRSLPASFLDALRVYDHGPATGIKRDLEAAVPTSFVQGLRGIDHGPVMSYGVNARDLGGSGSIFSRRSLNMLD